LEQTQKSHLIDFIDGYLKEFPEEENIIKSSYKKATGLDYDNEMPADLWLMLKDQQHGILALDAYAGLTIPVYTFSLNGAEFEDFMMIKNFTKEDAQAILNYRANKFFEGYNEIELVKGLSVSGKKAILESKFDPTYFNALEFPEELNLKSVIIAPVKNLIAYTLIYFSFFMLVYFFVLRKEQLNIWRRIAIVIKYMLFWLVFVLSGLIIAAFGMHWYILIMISLLLLLISLFTLKGHKQRRTLTMVGLMTLSILFSLV
jgi:hypothetical protein